MAEPIRGMVPGSPSPTPRQYGSNKGFITYWDLSDRPNTNDRIRKLGKSFDGTRGGAIDTFDPTTLRSGYFDGVHDRAGIMATRLHEPDNWLFRMHDEKGAGIDNLWDLRLIIDHTNLMSSRKNRSTYVIDQCEDQRQGMLSDLIWGVDMLTDVGDDELIIGPDGFTRMLASDFGSFGGEEGVRLALAFNIAGNAGFVTDGQSIAQLSHIFRLWSNGAAETSGTTVCQPKVDENDKSKDVRRTLCLDGAVNFLVETDLCHLGISSEDSTEPECGQPYIGRLFVRDEKSARGSTTFAEPAFDPVSNHDTIVPDSNKSLWVIVRVPEDNNGTPTGAPAGGSGGTGGTPTPSLEPSALMPQPAKRYSGDATGSVRPGAVLFEAGDFEVIEYTIPIRNPLEAGTFIDFFVFVRPTAAYGGGEASNLCFLYRPLARGVDATATLFTELTKTLDSSFTLVTADGWNQVLFRIPAADLVGADGGLIQAYLFMLSDSTGPDLLVA